MIESMPASAPALANVAVWTTIGVNFFFMVVATVIIVFEWKRFRATMRASKKLEKNSEEHSAEVMRMLHEQHKAIIRRMTKPDPGEEWKDR